MAVSLIGSFGIILFHKIHIPLGILLIAAGLLHGLLAENPPGSSIRQASFGKMLSKCSIECTSGSGCQR